jgi:serine/threonine protein kinase
MHTRYLLHEQIGSGGMATVHIGRLVAPLGFSRVVAIKRLHESLSRDARFAAMLLDEARIAARVRHPNVVSTLDVIVEQGECRLVMESIEGESLASLLQTSSQRGLSGPPSIADAIAVSVLHGLHAAHIARSPSGEPLGIMHRDVSPQNVLVGTDGVARIFDFGIAKAVGCLQQTRVGEFKGKLAYVAPERLHGLPPTQSVDVYSSAVVLWETLTGSRLFHGASEEELCEQVLRGAVSPPSHVAPSIPAILDGIVLRGLSSCPDVRFQSAEQMALALERAIVPATTIQVGAWVRELAAEALEQRAALVAAAEAAQTNELGVISAEPSLAASSQTNVAAHPEPEDSFAPLPGLERRIRLWPILAVAATLGGAFAFVAPYSSLRLFSQSSASPSRASNVESADIPSPVSSVTHAIAATTAPAAPSPERAAPERKPSAESASPKSEPAVSDVPERPTVVALHTPRPRVPSHASHSSTETSRTSRRSTPLVDDAEPRPAARILRQASSACSPPYTIERGIKRFKIECF